MRADLQNLMIAELIDGSKRYIGPMCIMADFLYNDTNENLKYIFLEEWNHECDTCGIYKIMVLHQENENEIFVSDPMRKDPTLRVLNKNEIKYKEVAFDIQNLCPIDYKNIKSTEIFDQSEEQRKIQDKLKSLKALALSINQNFQTIDQNKKIDPKTNPLPVKKTLNNEPKGLGDSIKKITDKFGIQQCKGCKKRQMWLNKAFPYNKNQQ